MPTGVLSAERIMSGMENAATHTTQIIDSALTLTKALAHLKTITRHKLIVGELCFKVGLYAQGIAHDLSKYSPTELAIGARYFQGTRSPNDAERRAIGFSTAWLHHKGRNKHHFEYWVDIAGHGDLRCTGKPMPTRYVIEMLCDRIAACKVYQGSAYTQESALNFFIKQEAYSKALMHPQTFEFLEYLLGMVALYGEDEALRMIRRIYVEPRASYGDGIAW